MRPRADIVTKRFLDGDTIGHLAFLWAVRVEVIEDCIRRRFESLRKSKKARRK